MESLSEEDELTDEQQEKLEETEGAIEALQARQRVYRSEDIAIAGAIVAVAYRGGLDIRRGLVKPEDKGGAATSPTGKTVSVEKEETGLPASLLEHITALCTAAMRVEYAKRPSLALATVVYTLACRELHINTDRSCLKMLVNPVWLNPAIKHADRSPALVLLLTKHPLLQALPTNELDLWQYCLKQTNETLIALLAVLTAPGIDAVDYKTGAKACRHAAILAEAMSLDMTKHVDLTAETYFSRLPKPEIIKAIAEMDSKALPTDVNKLKNGALAELAERTYEATGRKWLPEPLRSANRDITRLEADPEITEGLTHAA